MKRRTALKRLAAGAGSTFALVGAASAESYSEQPTAEDAEVQYLVTEDGIKEVEPDDDFCHDNPECCPDCCSECPDECYDGCRCGNPGC